MKKLFLLLMAVLSISLCVSAQTRTVKGTVVYAGDQEPLPGVTIQPVGGGNGVATDLDGNFSIEVPAKVTQLNVSYVGMVTKLVTITSGDMRIEMTNSENSLDEVMVVAYGTAKKSTYTGSASVVKADDINKVQTSNAVNALNGKVSGVQLNNASGQPGVSTPTIRIRGISSINAGNAPLYIVDGAPYDGDLNNISSQDIESMTVLKDAASNALYGARGANGVIVITTKKGKQGDAKVTLDAKWGVNTRASRDYNTISDPAQYYEMYYNALKNYYVDGGSTEGEAHMQANAGITSSSHLGYNVYTVPEGEYLIGLNGKLNPNATLGNWITYKGQQYYLTPDDWLDEAYKNSLRQEYNLAVNGGNERSSFYASLGYLDNEGITANSNYERLTGRLKADYQVKNWLKVGGNMSYTHYEANSLGDDGASNSSGNIFAYATQVAPIYPLYIRDGSGNIMKDDNGFTMYDFGSKDNAGLSRPILAGANPYSTNILDTDSYEGNAMTAQGFAEIKFLKDFKFTWNSGVTVDETRSTTFSNPYYGQYASSNGISYKYHTRSVAQNHQQLLSWGRQFGAHNVDALLGHEYYNRDYYYLYGSKSNFFDPTNNELAGGITENGVDSYTTQYNTEGFFGRVQYDYDSKYFASASFRRDASSRFHPDNRWGNFWSAGAAWNIANEEFFKDLGWDFVDLLKLKASYGEQGNDNIGNYLYVNTYEIVNAVGNPGAVPYAKGNKDITWETQGNFNTGIDFGLWNGRLSGTLEFFSRTTSDMLFSFPLPPTYGYTSYAANIGDMRNRGIELELQATPIQTRDFSWSVNFNLTHYKNEIISLPEERRTMTCSGVEGFSSGNYYYGEGISLYTFRLKQYAGVNEKGESTWWRDVTDNQGNVVGREATSVYDDATYYLCGTALPDIYGGFGTSLTYKGFDLSVDFSYQIGGQVYDSDYANFMSSPTSTSKGQNFHADLLNSWSSTNQGSNIPRFQYGDSYSAASSDRFLTDASYLSLNNVNFGYTLPSALVRKAGMEKVRLYVSADNIWYWSKRQGLDPRQSISGGASSSYYAPIRTISGGLTLTF